jgi:hypothetical protein
MMWPGFSGSGSSSPRLSKRKSSDPRKVAVPRSKQTKVTTDGQGVTSVAKKAKRDGQSSTAAHTQSTALGTAGSGAGGEEEVGADSPDSMVENVDSAGDSPKASEEDSAPEEMEVMDHAAEDDRFELAFAQSTVGPPIDEKLAKFAMRTCTEEPLKDHLAQVKKTMQKPSNTPLIVAPEISKAMRNNLKGGKALVTENHLYKAQNAMMPGLYGLLYLADKCKKLRAKYPQDEMVKETYKLAQDCVLLGANSSYSTSMDRRANLEPTFGYVYKDMGNKSKKITTLLYGDDFTKDCKELDEASKALSKAFRRNEDSSRKSNRQFKSQNSFRANQSSSSNYQPRSNYNQSSSFSNQSFRDRPYSQAKQSYTKNFKPGTKGNYVKGNNRKPFQNNPKN